MKNQVYTGTPTSRRFVVCPSTVVAGDAVLVGSYSAVALNSYQSNTGGAVFDFSGSFALTVNAWTGSSPLTGSAVNPGDKVYASGGTLDATTNVTTGISLSKNTGGTLFGHLDPSGTIIASGATDTAATVALEADI